MSSPIPPRSRFPEERPLGSRSVRELPRDDHGCGWIETLPPPSPARRLAGTVEAEAAVIGAGFTGLAVARRLAELRPEWRVVVVEAQRAGFGASGRSSGFVVDLAHFVARMEPEASRRYVALARFGIDALRTLVRERGIACDWDERGWMHVAAGPVGLASLPGLERWLGDLGEPYERLDREGLAAVTGTTYYQAGIRLPGSVLVQPMALARGLAAALPAGVELYEGSPVTRLERGPDGRFRLAAGEGAVAAERLFLAANGGLPALGALGRRLFPLYTFGSLTRPLTAAEQASLGGEPEWGVLAEDPMGSTVRRTRDQRILVRNSALFTRRLALDGSLLARARAAHDRAFAARFPALAAVELEHTWSGLMGATPDRAVAFGEIEPGLFATGGYTGAGIAMGTTAGTLLADLALGERSDLLAAMLALPQPRRLPPQPFLDWGIRWRVARMNAAAGPTL